MSARRGRLLLLLSTVALALPVLLLAHRIATRGDGARAPAQAPAQASPVKAAREATPETGDAMPETGSGGAKSADLGAEDDKAPKSARGKAGTRGGEKPARAESRQPAGDNADTLRRTEDNLGALDRSRDLSSQSQKDRDRQGRGLTRRKTPASRGEGSTEAETPAPRAGARLRLEGRPPPQEAQPAQRREQPGPAATRIKKSTTPQAEDAGFCPYGRPIKCELVFTVDSTMEETPLVGLVTEPVYNNGLLVIPAGAELHGLARPDRLRDRIFTSNEWVLLLPRDGARPNGRQLRVKGLALDREEAVPGGLSWGITDGSAGLRGEVLRTLRNEELLRFASGFVSAATLGLQEREATQRGGTRYQNSPTNAALQGLSQTMEELSRKISAEIQKHGVFLRVPGGKQFYFYPQQAIHPARAEIPAGDTRDAALESR